MSSHTFAQHVPSAKQLSSQPQLPPEPPHSQSEHESGSSWQSARHEHESSPKPHDASPHTSQPKSRPRQMSPSHTFAQHVPSAKQLSSQPQLPPEPPHSQVEHASGSSSQSFGHVHESSAESHTPLPQLK